MGVKLAVANSSASNIITLQSMGAFLEKQAVCKVATHFSAKKNIWNYKFHENHLLFISGEKKHYLEGKFPTQNLIQFPTLWHFQKRSSWPFGSISASCSFLTFPTYQYEKDITFGPFKKWLQFKMILNPFERAVFNL